MYKRSVERVENPDYYEEYDNFIISKSSEYTIDEELAKARKKFSNKYHEMLTTEINEFNKFITRDHIFRKIKKDENTKKNIKIDYNKAIVIKNNDYVFVDLKYLKENHNHFGLTKDIIDLNENNNYVIMFIMEDDEKLKYITRVLNPIVAYTRIIEKYNELFK